MNDQNFLARTLMQVYNSKGIFGNVNDNAAELERVLKDNFSDSAMHIVGCVAFFVGRP
jgi:hypothetical protein